MAKGCDYIIYKEIRMEADFQSLANSYISNLTPYQPGKPIEELERELGIVSAIKLASNENALGASPKALAAAQIALANAHFYPDGGCFELKQTLAKFLNMHANQLTIGNGSENVLEIIVKAYLSRGDAAVISQYAFLTIPLLIKSHGAEIIKVPASHFGHDIPGIIAAVNEQTRIIFIVNPNNPTGTYIPHDDLILLLNSISPEILVVMDEAYNEYIDQPDYPDTLKLLASYPNMVVTRTFSKAYGLAALRVGFAASSPEIADILNRARMPFNVNTIAAVAARAALLDQDHVARSIVMNKQGMLQMEAGLKKLNVNYIPSLGNFIAIDVQQSAAEIYQQLLQLGVIVRPLTAYDMPNYIRVTIGTAEQNERFLQALQTVIKG
jgi:histidinol-phosphate aminotransferase